MKHKKFDAAQEVLSDETKANSPTKEDSVHLAHCYQGENEDSCKYGDNENCPANPQTKKGESLS